ncbi:MAG: GNAT family N-acetyltransferase [Pseudomonadota bacterium]
MTLKFRPFVDPDLAGFQRWFEDPEIARRLDFPSQEWLDYVKTPDAGCLVVCEEGTAVAVVQMDHDPSGCEHLSLVVNPKHRHAGIGARVMTAFFAGPGKKMRELCACIDPDNKASLALAKRLGFSIENTCDRDGMVTVIRQRSAA